MDSASEDGHNDSTGGGTAAIDHLRRAKTDGRDWPASLLEAMALWTAAQETYRRRVNTYLICGEAFDWLLLAERLIDAVAGLVPDDEKEDLLFSGRFPASFDVSQLKGLLGVDKYRGYLNYYYGVTVEEALQLATELELQKRDASNGVRYRDDSSEEAFSRVYGAPKSELLSRFREETGSAKRRSIGVSESKEFTYWLFKYRLQVSDKPKIASDTKKGIDQLRRMSEAWRAHLRRAEPPLEAATTASRIPTGRET